MAAPFDFGSFIVRFVAALVLVVLTWNPLGWSYVRWVNDTLPNPGPVVVLAGLVLAIGWIIYLRATFRSLGALGLALAVAVAGTLIWLLIDVGLVTARSVDAIAWLVIVALALVMAAGMSWSHVRRRLTGQVDVDDVDEG